ncbi:MAG: long-chain fatty acid--CoA ligase [Nitrospinota bacterium]
MLKPWLKYYQTGVPHSIDYPDILLYQLLDDAAKNFPDNAALIFFGYKITFKELSDLVERFASALLSLGVVKGSRVAILLPNSPQFVITYYATLKIGGIVVPTNPLYKEREFVHQFNDSGAETIILLDIFYKKIKDILHTTPLKNLIITSIKEYLPLTLSILYPIKQFLKSEHQKIEMKEGVYSFKELIEKGSPIFKKADVNVDDTALLQYTGGTTGISKGVILTHRNMVANALQCRSWFVGCKRGKEMTLCVIPLFHIFGMTVGMNFPISMGSTIILLPQFNIMNVLKAIERYKITIFPGVPTIYVVLNNNKKTKKYDVSSISYCLSGGAPLPGEVLKRFEEITGGSLVEGYGLSEASPVTHCSPLEGLKKEGSIGIPFPDTEAKIVGGVFRKKELPPGKIGELVIRGPQVMKGYWNMPKDTKESLRKGWLYTGDMAKMDEDGYFYIVDRKKELIISGGENIYPREIEEILYRHPRVLDAAVVGIPDEYRGEIVKVYVVPKEGVEINEEEIINYCKENLAKFKVPKIVEFRNEMPKSILGKILKRVLLEEEKQKQKVGKGD